MPLEESPAEKLRSYAERTTGAYIYANEVAVLREAAHLLEEHRSIRVNLAARVRELEAALRKTLYAFVDADRHIKNELQPEWQKLADGEPLDWRWPDTPYSQEQAAKRLATRYHGVGSEDIVASAHAALTAEEPKP